MKRIIYFCKSWFRARKKPTEVWGQDCAELNHSKGLPYTVLVDSVDQPYCFLDISAGVVAVGFLDENLRESLTYVFQKVESEKLFLSMATHREFDGDTDKVIGGVTYFFEQDGTLKIKHETLSPHNCEENEAIVDVRYNYSDFPNFGEYEDLIKVERS